MCACDQARDQLSKCSLSGSDQGELKMALSSLKDVITAQSSGRTTMIAQMTRIACEKTLSTPPLLLPAFTGAARVFTTWGRSSTGSAVGGVSVVFISTPAARAGPVAS